MLAYHQCPCMLNVDGHSWLQSTPRRGTASGGLGRWGSWGPKALDAGLPSFAALQSMQPRHRVSLPYSLRGPRPHEDASCLREGGACSRAEEALLGCSCQLACADVHVLQNSRLERTSEAESASRLAPPETRGHSIDIAERWGPALLLPAKVPCLVLQLPHLNTSRQQMITQQLLYARKPA